MSHLAITDWDIKFQQQAYDLLNKYEETSLFLLANLKTYGPKLTDASYSADFKCLIKDNLVVAIFALTKIGNLLIQTDRKADYSAIIIDECLKSSISLQGIIGDWSLAKQAWDYAKIKILSFNKTPCKKSILFKLVLNGLPYIKTTSTIRYLEPTNYAEWNFLNNAFLAERNLNQGEGEPEKYQRFLENTKRKYLFGLFAESKLVATASFVSCVGKTGQIGDVFTVPGMRKLGLAKELVYQLLLDGKINKHLEKVILFTSEDNLAAIKLYKKLGFKQIGYFGLLFGNHHHG